MASNDIGDWYRSIPQISRYWFTGSVVLPLIGKLGLVTPMSMVLLFDKIVYEFNVSKVYFFLTVSYTFLVLHTSSRSQTN